MKVYTIEYRYANPNNDQFHFSGVVCSTLDAAKQRIQDEADNKLEWSIPDYSIAAGKCWESVEHLEVFRGMHPRIWRIIEVEIAKG